MFHLITLNMPILSDLGKPQKKMSMATMLGGDGGSGGLFCITFFFLGRCCKKLFVNILFTFSEI